jgi:hypothetical protein
MLRIVDEGPRPFYRAAIVSLAVTSVLAVTIAVLIRPPGAFPWPQQDMIAGALAALCLSAAGGIASLAMARWSRPAAWLDRVVAPGERAAIWLALAAWFPFLLVVVFFRAEATFPPSVRWLYYGFTDKRWVSACYPLVCSRLAAVTRRPGGHGSRACLGAMAGPPPTRQAPSMLQTHRAS